MTSLEDIPAMLEELKTGSLTFQDVSSLCLDLFEHHDVEVVLAALPAKLRDDLTADMISFFDNDTPPEDFMLLSSARGDHPAKLIIINKVRHWLKARGESSQGPSG
jgi:hypothetical protein